VIFPVGRDAYEESDVTDVFVEVIDYCQLRELPSWNVMINESVTGPRYLHTSLLNADHLACLKEQSAPSPRENIVVSITENTSFKLGIHS
jgi:hypothetical protein